MKKINNLSKMPLNVKSACVENPTVFIWVKAPFEIKCVFNWRTKDASA